MNRFTALSILFSLLVFSGSPKNALAAAQQPPESNLTSSGSNSSPPGSITPEEKDYLSSLYQDIWNYLAIQVDSATGLPFDSDTRQPATSISNVGLYLAATAVAFRTNLISREEAVARISMALSSLEKIERWEGFPRVWITTHGLKPVTGTEVFSYSKHISNLIGGLILVQSILPGEFSARVGNYMRGMKFKNLYDPNTGWLKGGYDVIHHHYAVNQPFGPWYYKFFASEARLISFYVTAKGFAPQSHWQSLIRPVHKEGSNWFFVSSYEDGGAYMPYMASLYIDERDTLMGISQKNLSAAQIKHAQNLGAPVWGWSAGLDMRNEYIPYGQLKDTIVAPYASIFAIHYFPGEVIQNLKALEALGGRPVNDITRETLIPTAFIENQGVSKPWAMMGSSDVFFINKNGGVERFSDFIIQSPDEDKMQDYPGAEILRLLSESGANFPRGAKPEDWIQSVHRGTLLKPGLAGQLIQPSLLAELLNLAGQRQIYSPGYVLLTNGKIFPLVFSSVGKDGLDDVIPVKPWAIAGTNDVFFIPPQGSLENLSAYITPPSIPDVLFNDFPDPLDKLLISAGVPIPSAGKSSISETLYKIRAGTLIKPDLSDILPSPLLLGDLLSLGTKAGLYHPAEITLANGKKMPALFIKEAGKDKPLAVAAGHEVYFLNARGEAEPLSPYLRTPSCVTVHHPEDDAVSRLSRPLGYSGKAGQGFETACAHGKSLADFFEKFPDSAIASQLLSLAANAGIYSPGKITFQDKKDYPAAFLSVKKPAASPVIAAASSHLAFINHLGQTKKMEDYLEAGSSNQSIKKIDAAALTLLAKSTGFKIKDGQTAEPLVTSLTAAPSLKPGLAETLENPAALSELMGAAGQAGTALTGQIKFREQRKEKFGFRDGVDWKNKKVSDHFLTPSQGMAFLSLANFLHDGVVWKSFSQDPKIRQGLTLLKEAPGKVALVEKQGADYFCGLQTIESPRHPT